MIASILILLGALAPSGALQTGYPRTMYVGYQRAPVYESADYLSTIVAELRRGDSVRVLGASGKFFRIERDSSIGYVLGSNLTMTPSRKKQPKARETTASPRRTPPPATASDTSASRRSPSTQCSATTRSGTRCSRLVDDGSSACWQHRKK